jgi:hypothetical protein
MARPKAMNFTTQAIICLVDDLADSARARQAKREEAGDGQISLAIGGGAATTVAKSELFLNGVAIGALPAAYRVSNSRLIIFGHGNPESTHIRTNAGWWTPKQLAERIEIWLNSSIIKRIALNMCYSGGNRAGAAWNDTDSWNVGPWESFAYQLARHCGYAREITAATDVITVRTRTSQTTGQLVRDGAVVFNTVGGRYKARGDMVILYPTPGATPDHPVDPQDDLNFKSSNKAKPW